MTDRAPQVAEFFLASRGMPNERRRVEMERRFPGLQDDELKRAVAIAQELLYAEAAEYEAQAAAIDAELARRAALRKGGAA